MVFSYCFISSKSFIQSILAERNPEPPCTFALKSWSARSAHILIQVGSRPHVLIYLKAIDVTQSALLIHKSKR